MSSRSIDCVINAYRVSTVYMCAPSLWNSLINIANCFIINQLAIVIVQKKTNYCGAIYVPKVATTVLLLYCRCLPYSLLIAAINWYRQLSTVQRGTTTTRKKRKYLVTGCAHNPVVKSTRIDTCITIGRMTSNDGWNL